MRACGTPASPLERDRGSDTGWDHGYADAQGVPESFGGNPTLFEKKELHEACAHARRARRPSRDRGGELHNGRGACSRLSRRWSFTGVSPQVSGTPEDDHAAAFSGTWNCEAPVRSNHDLLAILSPGSEN